MQNGVAAVEIRMAVPQKQTNTGSMYYMHTMSQKTSTRFEKGNVKQ